MTDNEYFNFNPDGSRCTSWIQHPITGKLIPRSRYQREDSRQYMIMKPIDEFKSPIDGSVISCRSQLRQHNQKHGVTNTADYGPDYFKNKSIENANKAQGKTAEAKAERRHEIGRVMHRFGVE